MVGDGHAMGVAAQILQHVFGAAEGAFGVDHPVLAEEQSPPRSESFRLGEWSEVSMEVQLAILKSLFEAVGELAAKDSRQHLEGKKESVLGFYPVGVIGTQPTGGNDAMHMGMQGKLLTPGMQHAEETDLRTEVSGIASHFEKSFRTDTKQQAIDEFLVLQRQGCQLRRKREDHVNVARREEFLLTRGNPTVAGSGLTLRAVPVSAGVVRDGAMSAAGALIDMTAESGGATTRNGQQHFDVLPAEPLAISLEKCSSRATDKIGHLEGRPIHLLFPR